MRFPFISGEVKDGFLPVNMFFSPQHINGKDALVGRPGLKSAFDLGSLSEVTALHSFKNRLYATCNNRLWRISESGSIENLGYVNTTGQSWIENNGNEVQILGGNQLYNLPKVGNLQNVSVSFIPGSLGYIGGYFVAHALGTKNWYEGAVDDGTDYNELDYAIVTVEPSNMMALHINNGEVWSFKEKSYEVYFNSGGTSFGFSKSFQGCIEDGLIGPKGACASSGSLFWVSDKKTILASNQYAPNKISTDLIDRELKGSESLFDVVSFDVKFGSHAFIVFTFPSINKTFVYDASTQFWFQWGSYPDNGRFRGNCYAKCWDRHFVGDFENGLIYELDSDTHTDNGNNFLWQRTVGVETGTTEYTFWPHLVLDFESGTGLPTGQGDDPQAMLQLSRDRGHTWGGERWKSIGAMGNYAKRVMWRGFGASRYLTVRVSITDPVRRVCTGAYFE